jgi:hypothetical protein
MQFIAIAPLMIQRGSFLADTHMISEVLDAPHATALPGRFRSCGPVAEGNAIHVEVGPGRVPGQRQIIPSRPFGYDQV